MGVGEIKQRAKDNLDAQFGQGSTQVTDNLQSANANLSTGAFTSVVSGAGVFVMVLGALGLAAHGRTLCPLQSGHGHMLRPGRSPPAGRGAPVKAWQHLKQDRLGLCCLIFIMLVLAAGLLSSWIAPCDPLEMDVKNKFAPWGRAHWLGTDHLGRDILSRLLFGVRSTLGFSLLAMLATVAIGTLLGMLAGLLRGSVEALLMRLCDVMMSFPSEVMILAIVGMLGPGLGNVVLAAVVAKWPWYKIGRAHV